VQEFRRRLRQWHRRHGRDLPWRAPSPERATGSANQAGGHDSAPDPYRVWVSEIMLQQTTVAAVKPYFERFLDAFPTLGDLARAPEQEVLRQWEGLGYYRRARSLHRAAQLVLERHDGELPRDLTALQALPGIGRYTSGAIASFAFGQAAPILEANTLRLYARLLELDLDPRSADGQKWLWAFAEQLTPTRAPGDFNQALIELGATV